MILFQRMAGLMCALLLATSAAAQDVRITTFKDDSTFTLNGRTFTVTRDQNTAATLQGDFARTSRACPPNCIQPMIAATGVATYGELEVLGFMETKVTDGAGLLLDVRNPDAFATSSIPGAVNVPFMTLTDENRFRKDILRALGAVDAAGDTLDFTNAMSLTVFSGGVWSSDAITAINNLLSAGYPARKLSYYRGGMQAWLHVGLTVQ
ncbi:rhodanese-like domain-containing protein [Octadecabacter sp. G9-8]|uniref:Rhodanese-like domain-containing protein n=1 Tax=Octadecabacter dasysiphoniae TaxID=2909341 RepID=A0ABS9CZB2_9RHOB|nr:rhodanese-like domain-containing protein [Octadecabacter dasysiphoniae]MCF2871725.1 rhodanese-like domain-containing protein [Octadecabacter dasysiphoniae]